MLLSLDPKNTYMYLGGKIMTTPLVKLSAQEQRTIDYMREHGGISNKEAIDLLGDGRVASTILRLRKKGFDIRTLRVDIKNRYGESTWYGKYVFGNK